MSTGEHGRVMVIILYQSPGLTALGLVFLLCLSDCVGVSHTQHSSHPLTTSKIVIFGWTLHTHQMWAIPLVGGFIFGVGFMLGTGTVSRYRARSRRCRLVLI
jgi:hypothetical protein